MMTDFTNLAQQWLAFSLLLAVQLLLVLALRKPVRQHLGAVACYRLWLLPLCWLPLYFLGPMLLQALAAPTVVDGTPVSAAYQQVLQDFVAIELLPFTFDPAPGTSLAVGGDHSIQGWSVLAFVWLAGTAALILWHGRRWLAFSREVRTLSAPLSSAEKDAIGCSAHFAPELPVVYLQGMSGAALFGVFKPALLLPETFCERYDSAQRQIIFSHESVHLRRGDNRWNLCALLLIALFWTNPLVFIAWRYFRLDQELSCDALALARCTKEQRKRYAHTLLHSLGTLSAYNSAPALSAWDNLRDIKERSLMVTRHLHTASRPVASLCSLLSLAAIGASLTITFAELVSPVAQAAEPARAATVAEQAREQARAVEQASRQEAREVQQAVADAQQAAERTQREVQASQAALQRTQQEADLARRQTERTLREAQLNQQSAQDAQRRAEYTQQDAQRTQQEVQLAQQSAQRTHLEAQAAQQAAQRTEQELQATQQQLQRTEQELEQAAEQDPQASTPKAQNLQVAQASTQVIREAAQTVQPAIRETPMRQPKRGFGQLTRENDDGGSDDSNMTIDQQTGRVFSNAIDALNTNQYADAREALQGIRVNRLSPFERSRYEQLMYSLDIADGNYAGAREHLQAALDSGGLTEREASQMRYGQAQLYIQEENYVDAAAALEAWIASGAEPNSGAYYLLAAAYYYLDQPQQAVVHAERAIEIDTTKGVAVEAHLKLLAALYTRLGRIEDAERVEAEAPELFSAPQAAEPEREQPRPVPVVRVNPVYPQRALARGLQGWVKVQFSISEAGEVVDPTIVESSRKAIFDRAALAAVSQWRYNTTSEREGMETTIRFLLADN